MSNSPWQQSADCRLAQIFIVIQVRSLTPLLADCMAYLWCVVQQSHYNDADRYPACRVSRLIVPAWRAKNDNVELCMM